MPSGYVTEPYILRQRTEQRNSLSDEHRHASNNESLNQPRPQEALNRHPSVDVKMLGAAGSQPRNNFSRSSGHLLHNATNPVQIQGATTQNHHAFVGIRPLFHGQNRLEGPATNHDRVDACYELGVAMGFAAVRRQKIELTVRSCKEAIDAGADKDRYRNSSTPLGQKSTYDFPAITLARRITLYLS